jgi:hypothetical protein
MKGNFMLRGIDEATWRKVKSAAALEGLTVSEWVLKQIHIHVGPPATGGGTRKKAVRNAKR